MWKSAISYPFLPGLNVSDGLSREFFNLYVNQQFVLGRRYDPDVTVNPVPVFNAIDFQYTPWEDADDEVALREAFYKVGDRVWLGFSVKDT